MASKDRRSRALEIRKNKNPFVVPKNMNKEKDIIKDRIEQRKLWITFFRRNPGYFVRDYFGITLYPYQYIMLWFLQKFTNVYIVASRASAKTFMIAIWALTLCVLYPGTKVVIVSKTIKQAALILSEKLESLKKEYPNVNREIEKIETNPQNNEAIFFNGSTIKVVPASENSRGNRATYVIVEESRLVSKEIIESAITPFLVARTPPYRRKPEYERDDRLLEEPIVSSITSAGWKNEEWFKDVIKIIKAVANDHEDYGFLAFDYLISLHHNIKTKKTLKKEMSADPTIVQMEYLNIPAGSSGKSYFKIRQFPRKMRKAWYPQRNENYNPKKNPHEIKKVDGEMRIISVDLASRAGKVNDNSIISCARLIPNIGLGYTRQLVYMESHKGENTILQAKRIKELFFDFDSDYLVLDIKNIGTPIFDSLSQLTQDEERGLEYDPFTVADFDFIPLALRKEFRERTLGINPLPVIFPITGTQQLNSQIASSLRSSLQKKLWNFLIDDIEAEEWLIKNDKDFINNIGDSEIRAFYLNPYIQTGLFVSECINLDMSLVGGLVKLTEKMGAYKDRYSSMSYMNWVISEVFDTELLKIRQDEDDLESLMAYTQFV